MREAYLMGPADYTDADLTKAKFTRKEGRTTGLYAEYTLGEAQGMAEVTAAHQRPPHADLEAAFARLVPHLCFLCRAVPSIGDQGISFQWSNPYVASLVLDVDFHQRPEFADYLVTGYSYDDKGGVVLIGQRLLNNGKVLNLIAPREDLSPEQETGLEYPYLLQLGALLGQADAEVKLYLGGKTGPQVVQSELNFSGGEDRNDA
jgi:hypothetical protein